VNFAASSPTKILDGQALQSIIANSINGMLKNNAIQNHDHFRTLERKNYQSIFGCHMRDN
jgi:hypothetical protein